MKLSVFAIFDNATKIYAQPFPMVSKPAAIRAFTDTCADPNSQLNKHPSDFHLFELGSYDDNSGTFENLNAPLRLCSALEVIEKKPDLPKFDIDKMRPGQFQKPISADTVTT